jgi:CubicO group peptidase (beta-lactamase class C family)
VRELVTGPLGLRDTGFRPLTWLSPADARARLVATATHRRRGAVHDPNAYALGGVAGHAGLFSTAHDLAVACQTLVNGGEYAGRRLLAESTVRGMLTDRNRGVPPGRAAAHGLGVDLDQPWYMGRLASPVTFGHTGFTGTSLVVDPARRAVLVVLTNRIHPSARVAGVNPMRRELAGVLADALPPAPILL